jgi:hypothetical protein
MSVYIDAAGRLVNEKDRELTLTCPHCQVVSHVTPSAVPAFDDLLTHRPRHVGVVFRCDSCSWPIFLRFQVRFYGTMRIDLAPQFAEVERARERFAFNYLPKEVEQFFREALLCYSAGAFNAFASMCRRAAQAVFADLGEPGKLQLFDELNRLRDMTDLDADTVTKLRTVVFGNDSDARPSLPAFDGRDGSVLLEVMKDLLYEAYVRRAKLRQALLVRRFFVDEAADNVTPIARAGS